MAHQRKKQSTGSWKNHRDKHEKPQPKGPNPERGSTKIVGNKKAKKDKKRKAQNQDNSKNK